MFNRVASIDQKRMKLVTEVFYGRTFLYIIVLSAIKQANGSGMDPNTTIYDPATTSPTDPTTTTGTSDVQIRGASDNSNTGTVVNKSR